MSAFCVYCKVNPQSKSEHVFPISLGGENIFMDCVCDECNNKFSTLERELIQKSMIGIMRSVEGIEGYSKGKFRTAPLKYPEIFQFVDKDKTVYEVGLHQGFKPFMRPQIILISGNFYAEGPSIAEMKEFIDVFNKWRKDTLVMITKFPEIKGNLYKAIKYKLKKSKHEPEEIEIKNDKKAIIHYTLMKENDEYYDFFEPRIFFDDSNRLIVRSRSIVEGKTFMGSLLDYCEFGAADFKSFSENKTKDPIKASMKFDLIKMQRALVKIGLNSLMYYFPKTKNDPLLDSAKDFVLKETEFKSAIDKKIDFFDSNSKSHTILFYQLKEGLLVRTSLFGGSFVYSAMIKDLNLFTWSGQFSVVEIDFKKRKQIHLKMDDFLRTRLIDLRLMEDTMNN